MSGTQLHMKRAGARDNTDGALAEDGARHNADLAFFRRHDARAVRAKQARLGAVEASLDANHCP